MEEVEEAQKVPQKEISVGTLCPSISAVGVAAVVLQLKLCCGCPCDVVAVVL
jgi:hypothetical protein